MRKGQKESRRVKSVIELRKREKKKPGINYISITKKKVLDDTLGITK